MENIIIIVLNVQDLENVSDISEDAIVHTKKIVMDILGLQHHVKIVLLVHPLAIDHRMTSRGDLQH